MPAVFIVFAWGRISEYLFQHCFINSKVQFVSEALHILSHPFSSTYSDDVAPIVGSYSNQMPFVKFPACSCMMKGSRYMMPTGEIHGKEGGVGWGGGRCLVPRRFHLQSYNGVNCQAGDELTGPVQLHIAGQCKMGHFTHFDWKI